MRCATNASAAVLFSLTWSGAARAQVNTEPLRKKLKTSGWSFTVQGSLDLREGNSEGVDVSTGGGTGFSTGRHLGFVFASAEYARYNGTESIDNSFVHARYNYEFLSWLWGEAFVQLQSDKFQRILLRNLYGVGPRFGIYQSPEFDVFCGTGWMLEHDAIDTLPGTDDRRDYWAERWNNYVSVSYQLDTRINFADTVYVQPRFDDFSDRRMLNDLALTFKVTTVLSAGITSSYRYDSNPPTGVRSIDIDLKNVLSLTY